MSFPNEDIYIKLRVLGSPVSWIPIGFKKRLHLV